MKYLRENVLFQKQDDQYDSFRKAYNEIIEEKINDGRQGIEQERYLTITIERNNFEEAKSQFATLEASIHKAFNELGADIVPLNGNQRLKVLYDYYHLGNQGEFTFDLKEYYKAGTDFTNDLCNRIIKFHHLDVWNLDLNDSKGWIREKGEFMLGVCEQCMGENLNSRQKSIIDRCIRKLYVDIARNREKYVPLMEDFYKLLMENEVEMR